MSAPYFAVDPLEASSVAGLLDVWERARHRLNGGWLYALLDSAFDEPACRDWIKRRKDRAVSLYDGTEFHELREVSPWIVRLRQGAGPDASTEEFAELCALRAGRPMLSFIASKHDLAQLKAHFRPFLQVTTGDGMPMFLRFADTRVIEPLLRVFKPEQRAAFVPPDMGFWFPQRGSPSIGGTLPDATRQSVELPDAVRFDDAQFAALMDASDVDLVIHRLTTTASRRFNAYRPSKVHTFVARQIERAKSHGLNHISDLEIYCNAAFRTGPVFDKHPAFTFAIQRASRTTGTLNDRFSEVPADAWGEVIRLARPRGNP